MGRRVPAAAMTHALVQMKLGAMEDSVNLAMRVVSLIQGAMGIEGLLTWNGTL